MNNKRRLKWLAIYCMLHASFTNTNTLSVLKNLQVLVRKLSKGNYKKAVFFSPFFTNTSPLVEAANHGTDIILLSQSKNVPKELQHPNITHLQAPIHDKLYFTQTDEKSPQWSCYLGSANFSHNGLENNRELIVQIEDPLNISGLAKHAHTIFNKSMIPENFPDPGRAVDSNFSELSSALVNQQLAELERFNQNNPPLTDLPKVISSFERDIVEYLSQNIKTDHRTCDYCISTMTLNHPQFIKKVLAAASLCDSKIKIIVDKQWAQKKLQSQNEFTHLVKKSSKSDKRIQIRAANKKRIPGYHHAKLLIREPICLCDQQGVTLVSTANITQQAKQSSNCILEIPHTNTEKDTTQELKKNFEDWWKYSEGISLS